MLLVFFYIIWPPVGSFCCCCLGCLISRKIERIWLNLWGIPLQSSRSTIFIVFFFSLNIALLVMQRNRKSVLLILFALFHYIELLTLIMLLIQWTTRVIMLGYNCTDEKELEDALGLVVAWVVAWGCVAHRLCAQGSSRHFTQMWRSDLCLICCFGFYPCWCLFD